MPRTRTVGAAVAASVALVVGVLAPASAQAASAYSFAVIGDVPYGSTQFTQLPDLVAQINADTTVQQISHVGDISSPLNCSNSYYASVKSMFDAFQQPFV